MIREGALLAIDLFSGAGGFSLGFELAGINVVAAIEFDRKAMITYEQNFPSHLTYCRDICEVSTEEVIRDLSTKKDIEKEEIDLIIGGPPCPGFSNIGRSKIIGLLREKKWNWRGRPPKEWRHQFIQDPRNKLFLEFVRFVRDFEPRGFVMENVTGMLSSKNSAGEFVIDLIEDSFSEIGYNCTRQVLSSDDFGVPQARKRVIFIGWKKDSTSDEFHYPVRSPNTKSWTSMDAISDLPKISQEGGLSVGKKKRSKNEFQRQMRYAAYKDANRIDPRTGKVPRISAKLSCHFGRWVNPRDRAIFPLLQVPENGKRVTYNLIEPSELEFPHPWRWLKTKKVVWNGKNGDKRKEYKWYNRTSFKDKMRRIPHHKPSPTLVAHMATDTYMFIHPEPNTHRTITPQEAARIQSFPDSFDFSQVSFTSQYRQIGNAVPPLMAKAIALEIKKAWRIE